MKNKISSVPDQLALGLKLAAEVKIENAYEKIILCGIGGSMIPGEILASYLDMAGLNGKVFLNRDYDLPAWASSNDLVVCISWSGNTNETLSSYEAAIDNGIPTVCITSGGELAELCKKNGTPVVLLPHNDLKPRFAVGLTAAALFELLGIGDKISEIKLDAEKAEREGKTLAEKLSVKQTVLLYSSYRWRAAPRFWKVMFNENCKMHAFWNYFPALAHNELAGFNGKNQDEFFTIVFKDPEDDIRQNESVETTLAILKSMGYNYEVVNFSSSDKPLESFFNTYLVSLWTTYYLAEKAGIDPEDIRVIEDYKSRIS